MSDDLVSERLAARLARQAILTRDDPPTVWFLVDEAALRRCVGSPEVMAAQLAHLAGVARLPNVTIQVVPTSNTPACSAALRSPSAPHMSRPRLRARYSRTPEIIAGLLSLRYAQERSIPRIGVPGLDRADVRGMESNWRKSSYSGSNGGECVEVAAAGAVLVRDTTDRTGPVLTFTADAWRAFTATIK